MEQEWTSGTSSWTTLSDTRFLYDGWNLIAEYDGLNGMALLRHHVWGLDLSGTITGAGGVGGLLWTRDHSTNKTYAAASDAGGNIVHWVDLETGNEAGSREYGPFGEADLTTGVARELPFAFSSKYEDRLSGMLYYGFRFYSPSQGQFLNRDPIEEEGGLNLYAFVGNDPVNAWDYLGLDFIAVGSRSLQGSIGRLATARHKSIYYFTVCHDLEEGDHLEFFEIPDTVEQEGFFELLGQKRYERKYSGIFGAERTQDITVSVVFDFLSHWSADAEEIVVIWSDNNQTSGSTEEAWATVDSTARNYRYGLHFPNLPSKLDSTNWPHVKYLWNQTNSTTFIRVLARSIERAANPGNVLGRHWGHSFPQAPIDYLLQERGYPERKW